VIRRALRTPACAALLAVAGMPVVARAQAIGSDPHIQTLPYDAGRTVPLRTAQGFVSTIAFGPDERIETVAVGNPGAWQVSANKQGDHLFVRALQDGGMTNLEVVTDVRHYSFLLSTGGAGDPGAVFSLRFDYGPADARRVADATPADGSGRYRLTGARRARPAAMSDDGRTTRVCWPARTPIPAVFAQDDAGAERLVNARVEQGCSVIDAVWPRYRFIAGKAVAVALRQSLREARR